MPQPPALPEEPRPVPEVLARAVTGALQRVAFKSGDVVSTEGIYFLNATTGVGEGWIYPGGRTFGVGHVSDDNRFIIARVSENGYLIDRQGGTVWQWDPAQLQALLADAHGFLFAELRVDGGSGRNVQTGRYFWAGPDLKVSRVFTFGGAGGWATSALLSPDGRRVAVLRRGAAAERPDVALVDLATGDLQQLEVPAAEREGGAGLQRVGAQFQVQVVAGVGDRSFSTWHFLVRRFNWSGEPQGDLSIPGHNPFFSPDGKWVAWEAWPAGDLAPATLIADAVSLQPRLQALGTTPCFKVTGSGGTRWLYDSSGLVVDSASGYRLLTLDGELQEPPAFAGRTWKGEPQPAPDHPDRFAIGRLAVTNGTGTGGVGVTLQDYVTPSSLSPWGESSAELRFALPPPARGGACAERPPMPTQVLLPGERLPELPLVVRSEGACLTLRGRPHESGSTVACLTDGTRLTPVRDRVDSTGIVWLDQGWWLYVRAEKGETGWVSLDGGHVTWAAP